MIINNNNNNGQNPDLYESGFPPRQSGDGDVLTKALEQVRSGKAISRSTYMTLAKFLGCFGIHCFSVRQWGSGLAHCLLSLIGLSAIAGAMIALAGESRNQDEILAVCLVCAGCLPLSIIAGIITSCYWFFHTDQEFESTFHSTEKERR